MRHRLLRLTLGLLGIGLGLLLAGRVWADTALQEADRKYAQQSYADALVAYRQALAKGAVGDRRTEVEYRIAVSLGRTRQWDEALATTRTFLESHPSGLWGARGYYWLGQLLTVAPHQGYKVGTRVYRGNDYPKVKSAEKPVAVYLGEEDATKAVASFEEAKACYERLRPRHGTEEADLNFDLATVLSRRDLSPLARALFTLEKEKRPGLALRLGQADSKEVQALRGHDWAPTPGKPYQHAQPLPQRILGLYQQLETLDPGRAPQARLSRANYLVGYQQAMDRWMQGYDEKQKEWVKLRFPYQGVDAIALLASIADDFPKHPLAPQAQLLAGQRLEEIQQFLKAEAAYREVVARWPASKWVSDAKARLQVLTWPSLGLSGLSQPAGAKPQLTLSGRNVKTVTLTAYRVRLEKLLLREDVLQAPRSGWADFEAGFGGATSPVWRELGEKVATWTHVTQDAGDHRFLGESATVPVTERGAYLVEGNSGEAHAATMVIITDLALVTKTDRSHSRVFVCNAQTGRAVPGAEVVIREAVPRRDNVWEVTVAQGQADPQGLFSKELMPATQEWLSHNLQAFAWVGDRYALSRGEWGAMPKGQTFDEYRGYLTTDRPVYRPGNTVHFRTVMLVRPRTREHMGGGAWQVAKELPFEVTATDTRGEKVFSGTYTTNEFGSLSGAFTLGAEPPLGMYTFSLRLSTAPTAYLQLSGNQFRVEEYKKPEFEVKVTPGAEQLRVGEAVKAPVEARYYFGSPVVGGKVSYRVFETPYYPTYHFPDRYDWLVRSWQADEYYYQPSYEEGEVVKTGEGTTDAEGLLPVEFGTSGGGQVPDAKAYTYTVAAEVTDPSRRVIQGRGEVRASTQQYFAFLHLRNGFYQEGDRIEIEAATRDVMDRPVAVAGTLRVDRVIYGAAPEDVVDAHLTDLPVKTDVEGRAFLHWTAKEAGYYRFQYQATDAWGQSVTSKIYTWVDGPDMTHREMHWSGIQLIPEKRTYEEGETCRLLIVADYPDATVLLTQEADRDILARAVLPLKGKSRVVEVKIGPNHVPNFRFAAAMVHDWNAYETSTEVFVPPANRFLDVAVSPEHPTYKPGEKATFHLKATDAHGQPVRTELSLGIVDASVYYIQPDLAPDPRLYFYGERRGVGIEQGWSLGSDLGQSQHTTRKSEQYKLHQFVLPEDMGQLQDWPADLIGTTQYGYYDRRHLGGLNLGFGEAAGRQSEMAPAPMAAKGEAGVAGGYGGAGGGMRGGGRGGGGAGGRGGMQLRAKALSAEQIVALPPVSLADGAWRPGGPLVAAQVRTRFADTAYWSPSIITDTDGTATVTVDMPENLTTWKATARGVTTEAQVGQGTGETITRKDLIVRLQAPRFFMERDLVVLSANVHNYLQSAKRAKVALALDGGTLELVKEIPAELGLKHASTEAELWLDVPKDGEQRVDWVVRVVRAGLASVRMTAQTDEESDATEQQFPVLVHGADKLVVQSGVMRDVSGTQTATVTLSLPKERRRGSTELNVQLTPSLGAVALDALPYLADYPYGCIEQTMSRFLPSVVVARTLKDLGLDLTDLQKRAAAYADERDPSKGAKPQPDSAYTYPKGMPGSVNAGELASRMYLRRPSGPIFEPGQLDEMVKQGLARIYSQQHGDGGWGWWPSDTSDPYMSAYVVYGIFTAREAGYQINNDALERGFQFLLKDLKEEDNLHRMAYLASVVTLRGSVDDATKAIVSDRLYRNRQKLTAYSQALLALSLKQLGEVDQARVVVDNLKNSAHLDRENGTANWPGTTRWWWHWWDDPVETNAAVLRAYVAVYPDGELAPMIVKWMVNNRRGNHWDSTKQTALAVYALADYIRVKKELAPDYTITVNLEGKVQRSYRVTRENALFFDNRFLVGDELLGDGPQTVTITVKGTGTLYYSAFLRYFSLEEDLKGAGNEIFVQRRYFKLTPRLETKTEGNQKWQELAYDREELPSGALLKSGDMIEVELVLDAKNDYDYVVFEDMKPAGCEPVELRSGPGEGAGVYSQMELRDEKVAFFISHLPQGTRAVRYRVRAEIPGLFHALPTNGYAMYAPDVRCLSDEWRAGIADE